jgi:hypothetical protein
MAKTWEELHKGLSALFPVDSISWRLGATNHDKTKGIALAYIDARDVMKRLDSVAGPGNWQNVYQGLGLCGIGVRLDGTDEWVWKWNGAGATDVEAEKGQASDAFKRAAVLWGVAQYLYDLPNVWSKIEPAGKSYKLAEQPKLPSWAIPAGKVETNVKKPDPVSLSAANEAEKAIYDLMKQAEAVGELASLVRGEDFVGRMNELKQLSPDNYTRCRAEVKRKMEEKK